MHGSNTIRCNDLRITEGFERTLRDRKIDTLDALFAVPNDGDLNKPGLERWRERIRIELDHNGQSCVFFLKRFNAPPRSAQRDVRRCGQAVRSVGSMEFGWMIRLAEDGIPCPTPVALGEEICGHTERRSAVLMRSVPGDSLERLITDANESTASTLRTLIEPLADLIARFHGAGYAHRDLYLAHIFYDADAARGSQLHLIDLQRVIRPSYRAMRWIVKDLAALNFSTPAGLLSRTDRMRWLTRYLGKRRLDAAGRRLAYRVIGKTERITRREARRARRDAGGANR